MFVYFHGGFTVAATSEDDGGRERKKVYCNEMGRVHLILNLYRGGETALYTSVRLVSKRTVCFETNASKRARLYFHYPRASCLWKVRGTTGRRIYPRRYVTEKRKVRSGVEREAERRETKMEARSLNYNADEN